MRNRPTRVPRPHVRDASLICDAGSSLEEGGPVLNQGQLACAAMHDARAEASLESVSLSPVEGTKTIRSIGSVSPYFAGPLGCCCHHWALPNGKLFESSGYQSLVL
jgi:hypothetical protein